MENLQTNDGQVFHLRVWLGKWIGKLAGALEHLSLGVRAIDNVVTLGHRLHFSFRPGAILDKVTKRDSLERVAGRADLFVNLYAIEYSHDGCKGLPHEWT